MNNWDQYQSTPKLLPPTVFERTNNNESSNNNNNATDNNTANSNSNTLIGSNNNLNDSYLLNESNQFVQLSNELEKLKFELKKLHGENEILRHKNRDFVEQAQLYTEANGHRQISISALEEIIHKQTREIQNLKCDLLNERETNLEKVKQIEEKSEKKIRDLEHQINSNAEYYAKQLEKCEKERETFANEQNNRIKQLINEKTKLCDEYQNELNDLRNRFEKFNKENLNSIREKDEQINKLTDENIKYLNELENLRRYVNDSMPTIETVKEMKRERKQLEDELVKSKSRNELLSNENSALQIRLKSISEILTIQEAQLETKLIPSSSNANSMPHQTAGLITNNEKKRSGLLGKWRNKVFELLVQLKTQEINSKQEKNQENRAIADCLNKLDEQISLNKILENVIEDKKAELTVLNNDNTLLTEQVSALKEANEVLEKKCAQDLQSTNELKSFIDSLLKQYHTIEDSFKLANRKLTHLDQRVEFAKNRLGVIQALYNRRESHLKEEIRRANLLEMTTNLSSIHGSLGVNQHHESHLNNLVSMEHLQVQHSSLDPNHLLNQNHPETVNLMKQELNKVVNERDMLAQKLKTDLEKMDENIVEMKLDYEKVISSLNNQLKDLKEENNLKQTQMDDAKYELNNKIILYEELNKKYQNLELELNDMRKQLTTEYEAKLKESEFDFMDKLAKMDEKLNEARREQAKAVVMMRQMERSTNREKERMDNMLKSCETYYKDHIDKLKLKIVSLEKEKNILMNTLRQNNLNTNSVLPSTSINELAKSSSTSNLKISKWLENNNLVELSTTTSNSTTSLVKNSNEKKENEVTSFWVESKQNEDDQTNENERNYYDEEHEEEFEMSKNTEILNQIRKIMGNLELSDLDDNENENNDKKHNDGNSTSNNIKYTNQETSSLIQDETSNFDLKLDLNLRGLQYESEHAIDDLFNYRKDILESKHDFNFESYDDKRD